jgi:hypothetical protein
MLPARQPVGIILRVPTGLSYQESHSGPQKGCVAEAPHRYAANAETNLGAPGMTARARNWAVFVLGSGGFQTLGDFAR